ncbi:arginine--tRNA ligase [Candidatus Parcubacteria bacterium]|nr:arginine--tRNA ligase [Candidatus Parcubacteria bacterium]
MNGLNSEIKKSISESLKKNFGDVAVPEFLVEKPKDASHGDYSTNVAMMLSKELKKSPMEIAQKIADLVHSDAIGKVQVVAPGFINMFLKDEVFSQNIKEVLKNKQFGANADLKNKKVIVEYTDPNILKEFHIGHLMSNSIGESISRIFQFQGAKVKRANYQSDVGLGIAKAVWGKMKQPELAWQQAYVLGTKEYEETDQAKQEMIELNKKIFQRSDGTVNALYDQGRKWSLEYFETIYKKLGTKFDYYFFESQTAGFGKKVVEEGLKKGIFETGDKGAIVFKGEKLGLHTRVFINSEGLPTYEAKDLGLAKVKYAKYKYDQSVIITANEINEYFKVVLSAMSELFPELEKKTKHLSHGLMRLPEGKMSSRTGKVVTAEFLIDKVKEVVLEKIKERDFSDSEKDQVAEKVAIGALKYSILKQSIGGDIIYDVEKSVSFQGDSGPYLQYSLARALSVLKKAKAEKIKGSLKKVPETAHPFIKMMQYFPEVVQKAGKEYQPHYIALYITELCAAFNHYYSENKIVDREDEFSPYKVAVTEAFTVIMKNGLWLLGIPTPEKM